MFSLVRSGPKMLVLESTDVKALKNYIMEQFNAVIEHELGSAFERASEEYTMLFLTERLNDIVNIDDIIETLIIPEESDAVLCKLINDNRTDLLRKIRTTPHIIMFRAIGDMEKVILEMQKDHGGHLGTFTGLLDAGREKGTLIALTDKPLHQNMLMSDIYKRCLYIDQGFYPLYRSLRLHALKYLNIGIGNKDWYEIEIRIYDRYSAYKLHYERLVDILDFLDLGIILGESWTKDYPRLMMAVGVYRIRFFTFHNPQYIKKILVGLEYLEDGTRIVDYDVYYQRKKMDWSDALQKDDPHKRHLMGLKYREQIYECLSTQQAEKIRQQEKEILSTRY